MFGKDNNHTNERIIYQTKSNFIFGCKRAIYGFIILIVLLYLTRLIIQFIGKMQVHLISRIQLPLTRYTSIAMFVLMLITMIYIVWQIISWYSKEYILTETKIVVKSGVLVTNKNNLPYSKIQDVNLSQSILGRIFNIGSISVYSAYDNNNILIENIGNPSELEDIIFDKMSNPHNTIQRNQHYDNVITPEHPNNLRKNQHYDDVITPEHSNKVQRNPYYDDVITPEHSNNNFNNQNYTYYRNESYPRDNSSYPQNESHETYNDPVSQQDNAEPYESYQRTDEKYKKEEPDKGSRQEESGEDVVKRHFKKFKG